MGRRRERCRRARLPARAGAGAAAQPPPAARQRPEPLLRFDADDVRFTFPGTSSWACELTSKQELRAWLQQFVSIGLELHADEVVIKGPPWNTTVVMRCSDHLTAPDGTRVYENRAVIWGRIAWGLLREYEVYEDTERSLALDAWLAAREQPTAA